jgi:elongation factor P
MLQCPPAVIEGIDVFDGQGRVEWPAVADAGVAFAWIKATQGTYDTQTTFAANWSGAAAAGILRGAYHFFDPREDGAAQAEHYLEVVASGSTGELPPMLDIECPDGAGDCVLSGVSGDAAPDAIAMRMRAFLRVVQDRTGRVPVVYTFETYFASAGVEAGGLAADPLFLAFPTDDSCFDVPAPWAVAAFWQYSWSGAVEGISGPVDRDRFIGTIASLRALAEPPADEAADAGDRERGNQPAFVDGGVGDAAAENAGADGPPEGGCACRLSPRRARSGMRRPDIPRARWSLVAGALAFVFAACRRRRPRPSACPSRLGHASWAPGHAMQTTDIRKGIKIQIDGVPYAVVEHQFVKPGKGQAFTRARIKNLSTGAVIERTWKSGESVELADVETRKMSFSWDEGDSLVFMDTNTGDQVHVMKDSVGDEVRFLSEGLDCEVTIYNGNPIGIDLPSSVVLQIKESEPGVKGDTASGATKPATLSTGASVNVPLFIKEGEWVKVDTRTGEYLERVNR